MYGRIYSPGSPRWRWLYKRQPISDQPEWDGGFHTVRTGIDLGGHRFCSRVVVTVDVWKAPWYYQLSTVRGPRITRFCLPLSPFSNKY